MASGISRNHSLKELNAFGVEALAAEFAEVNAVSEIGRLLEQSQLEPWILGGGSNLLLLDDISALVLLNSIKGIEVVEETDTYALVRFGGGEVWHEVVTWAVQHDLGGIENLALIPGSVGAAPIQNIGAYGVELKDVFHELEAYEFATGQVVKFDLDACQFGYRDSLFKREAKGKYFISHVTLRLSKPPHSLHTAYGAIRSQLQLLDRSEFSIQDVCQAVVDIRSAKLPDPAVIGNSGSFFKNPIISQDQFERLHQVYPEIPSYPAGDGHVKVPAGWLIEKAGWKGRKVGNVGCYKNQALVIVNHGGATGREVWEHAVRVQISVNEQFAIELEPEVNIIGER